MEQYDIAGIIIVLKVKRGKEVKKLPQSWVQYLIDGRRAAVSSRPGWTTEGDPFHQNRSLFSATYVLHRKTGFKSQLGANSRVSYPFSLSAQLAYAQQ